jgi:dienelactone hydrolase
MGEHGLKRGFPRMGRSVSVSCLMLCAVAGARADALEERLKTPVLKDGAFAAYESVYGEIRRADLEADAGFAACRLPEAFRKRQAEIKEKWLAALGGFPERTPLNTVAGETVARDGYTLTKIRFESQPGLFVTAFLFRPDKPAFKAPYPGILIPCGHSEKGKAYPAYQRAGLLAAQAGFAALCYDPLDQGERVQLAGPDAPVSVAGHNRVGVRAVLLGWNTARFRIWDGLRALDCLASLPEVDPERIGVMGNSGGGTLTAYLMNADGRVKAAAPACYITAMRDLCERSGPQDAEQNIFGQLAFGLNHAAYLVLRAPELAVCVNAAHDDFFPFRGTRASLETARSVYACLGYEDVRLSAPPAASPLGLIDVPGTHGWGEGMIRGSLQWMRAKLCADATALPYDIDALRKLNVETDFGKVDCGLTGEEAWVAPGGSVRGLPGHHTVYEIMREELARIDQARRQDTDAGRREKIRAALLLDRHPLGAPTVADLSETDCGEYTEIRQALRLDTGFAAGSTVPAVLLVPKTVKGDPALVVADAGKSGVADLVRTCLAEGRPVMAADLFATGETGGLKQGHHNFGSKDTNESVAMMLYLLGRSAIELRTRELLGCAEALAKRFGGRPVKMLTRGTVAIPAYHAYALAPERFSQIETENAPPSWREAVNTAEPYRFSDCLHNGLRLYDWTELYRPAKARGGEWQQDE